MKKIISNSLKKILENYSIKVIEKRYIKMDSKWSLTSEKAETVDAEVYANIFNSCYFFRNIGGYERNLKAYTIAGYIPYKNISISPDRKNKTERTFEFKKI